MKVGDLVMYVADDRYARWFFGKIGVVVTMSRVASPKSCRVQWTEPVAYHDKYTTFSDFKAAKFEVIKCS